MDNILDLTLDRAGKKKKEIENKFPLRTNTSSV